MIEEQEKEIRLPLSIINHDKRNGNLYTDECNANNSDCPCSFSGILASTITIASGEVTVYFPKDEKKFSVTKNAAEGATSVNVKSAMPIKASANSTGYVELDIDTGGALKGEFLITAGGIEKAVEIVSAEDMPIPAPTPTPSSSPISFPSPSPISSPQKITKPFPVPCVGFEAIGCIAIA